LKFFPWSSVIWLFVIPNRFLLLPKNLFQDVLGVFDAQPHSPPLFFQDPLPAPPVAVCAHRFSPSFSGRLGATLFASLLPELSLIVLFPEEGQRCSWFRRLVGIIIFFIFFMRILLSGFWGHGLSITFPLYSHPLSTRDSRQMLSPGSGFSPVFSWFKASLAAFRIYPLPRYLGIPIPFF